jgi:trypsin
MFRFVALLALVAAVSGAAVDIQTDIDYSKFNRIVGGSETTIQNRPFQVLVQADGRLYCGGTIISPLTILTAAHCATLNANRYSIRAGSTNQYNGGVVIGVSQVIRHGSYNGNTFDYDIAVFILSSRLTYGSGIQAASLAAPTYNVPDGANVIVSGWGDLASGGSRYPDNLHQVTVPKVSQATCRGAYGAGSITDRMLCAGIVNRDSCQGDSGGPLTHNDVHVGVVSWGRGCALSGYPGVYASTANLRSWIDANRRD